MISTIPELDWAKWKDAEHRKNSDAERVAVEGDDRGKVSHPDSDHSDTDDVLQLLRMSHIACGLWINSRCVCLWQFTCKCVKVYSSGVNDTGPRQFKRTDYVLVACDQPKEGMPSQRVWQRC